MIESPAFPPLQTTPHNASIPTYPKINIRQAGEGYGLTKRCILLNRLQIGFDLCAVLGQLIGVGGTGSLKGLRHGKAV